MTWLWHQPGARIEYTAQHVNAWAQAIRDNTTLDVDVACVTSLTNGIDPSIRIIKPPGFFETVTSPTWPSSKGWPQCYRRLALFHPDAAEIFGANRFVSMDVDILICGNLDRLFSRTDDFCIFRGTNLKKRPYNGGMVMMDAGARPQVFTEFTPEKAVESGRLYVGSDQAWISHCLGRGEATIGEDDGVVHWGNNWINSNGGHRGFKKPAGLCMVMFPGVLKAFNGIKEVWGCPSRKDLMVIDKLRNQGANTPAAQPPEKPLLYAYNDPKNWGVMFRSAALFKQYQCKLFDKADQVPPGAFAFVRVDQQDTQREISKQMVADLAANGVKTLPTAQEAIWYDDKGLQSTVLAQWMPVTHYIKNKREATQLAEHIQDCMTVPDESGGGIKPGLLRWPIYSKAIDGAGSKCVRVIRSLGEALAEIEAAFSPEGMPSAYTRRQQGYVLWQELIPNCKCTYRVTVIGNHFLAHERRHDKDGLPIPGENIPLNMDDEANREVVKLALHISDTINTRWMCYDFLRNKNGELFVIEMSSAWPTKPWFANAPVWKRGFRKSSMKGADMFKLAVDLLVSQ